MREIGYLKIHRKIKENILFQEKRVFSKFEAWIDILMDCNFQEGEFLLGYEIYKVDVGSYVTSKLKLQKKYGWSKGKLNNFLSLLEKQKMISQKTIGKGNNKATQLFVLKYKEYQYSEPINEPINEPKDNPKTTLSEPQYKKVNKEKKVNKIKTYKSKDGFDSNFIKEELKRFINIWNTTFLEKRQITDRLEKSYLSLRSKYEKEQVVRGYRGYQEAKLEIKKREGEFKYLLSPLSFFTSSKGLINYL